MAPNIPGAEPIPSIGFEQEAEEPPEVQAPPEQEQEQEELLPVVGIYDWLHEHGSGNVDAYYLALRLLQGSLANFRSDYIAISGGFKGEENDRTFIGLHAERVVSSNRIQTAWKEVISNGESFTLSLEKGPTRNEYKKVVKEVQQVSQHKRGPKNTFFFGFRDGDEYVVGLASYKEPKDKLRGPELKPLGLETFERVFLSEGGKLVTCDPPKRLHPFIAAGLGFAESYVQMQNTQDAADEAAELTETSTKEAA